MSDCWSWFEGFQRARTVPYSGEGWQDYSCVLLKVLRTSKDMIQIVAEQTGRRVACSDGERKVRQDCRSLEAQALKAVGPSSM